MARKSHFLRPTRGTKQPSLCCVLGVEFDLPAQLDLGRVTPVNLRSIVARHWRWTDSGRECVSEVATTSAAHWWDWLLARSYPGNVLWLFCGQCLLALSCLGLWERVEAGEMLLLDAADCLPPAGQRTRRRPWRGFCVLEDPPTIITVRRGRDGPILRCLDSRNYGVTAGPLRAGCAEQAQNLETWAIAYRALLIEKGLGTWQMTGASQALYSYKRGYLATGIGQAHGSPDRVQVAAATTRERLRVWVVAHKPESQDVTDQQEAGPRQGYVHDPLRALPPLVHTESGINARRPEPGVSGVHADRFPASGCLCDRCEACRLERRAYVGGRCECSYIGRVPVAGWERRNGHTPTAAAGSLNYDGRIYHLDLNGSYHAVAATAVCPARYAGLIERPMKEVWEHAIRHDVCIADVVVSTAEPAYPVRAGDGGLVLYPTGVFPTSLAHPELLHALQSGRLVRVERLALYDGEVLFGRWAADWHEWRRGYRAAGQAALADTCKRVGLSLYGKFGQGGKRWVADVSEPASEPFATWTKVLPGQSRPTRYRSIGWQVQREEDTGEGRESCPAIAGHITSAGRMLLWRLMRLVGLDQVWYVDTDSLWTTEAGYLMLRDLGWIDPHELGCLKVAGVHNAVEFIGIRHYVADGVRTCAGWSGESVGSGDDALASLKVRGVLPALVQGQSPAAAVYLQRCESRHGYRHGRVLESGRVEPWRYSYGEGYDGNTDTPTAICVGGPVALGD